MSEIEQKEERTIVAKITEAEKEFSEIRDIQPIETNQEKQDNFISIPKQEKFDLLDALKLVAPGTQLREAIDDIVKSKKGSLIVVDSSNLQDIIEGGFKLNCKFTQQRLAELAKMDGAIILSNDFKKILFSNCLLMPSSQIPSNETGTRHKAAERTAKHAKTLVISISERKNTITLYYNNIRYSLKNTGEILRSTLEKLNILEKQREIYNNLLSNLNTLEVANLVSSNDVTSILQRAEIILKIAEMIKRDMVELGNEGALVKIRLKELTKGVEKDRKLIIKDYTSGRYSKYLKEMKKLNFDSLLELSKISEIIFNGREQEYIKPKGYRLLEKLGFSDDETNTITNKFSDLSKIFEFKGEEKIFKTQEKTEKFIRELMKLKEEIMMGKNL